MKDWQKILLEEINLIKEAVKINFKDHTFALKVDVNEDPNKKGIKIQFLPTTFAAISKTEQDELAIELEEKLEEGLREYGMKVERDRNLKDKTIIGFFVYIEYIHKIVKKALEGGDSSEEL